MQGMHTTEFILMNSATVPHFDVLIDAARNNYLLLYRDRGHEVAVDVNHPLCTSACVQVPGTQTFVVAH